MKTSFKLFPLFWCLSLHSMAQTNHTLQKVFEFPEPLNDTAPVENWLELTESLAGISLTTLLNLGIWWGVCKTAGIVSGLSNEHRPNDEGRENVDILKADFCLQLAPIITTAEVALVSRSPRPLEQNWWKPVYIAAAGLCASEAYSWPERLMIVPSFALSWLAYEAGLKIVASTASASIPGEKHARDIEIERYVNKEDITLPTVDGILAGALTYQVMAYKSFNPAEAALASVVNAAIVGTFSGITSMSITDMGDQWKARIAAGAGAGAGAVAVAGAGAGAGAVVVVVVAAIAIAEAITIAGTEAGAVVRAAVSTGAIIGAGAVTGAVLVAVGGARPGGARPAGVESITKTSAISHITIFITVKAIGPIIKAVTKETLLTLLTIGGGTTILLAVLNSEEASNNPLITASITWALALLFTVTNGFSNYAAYGYPLEESLSEAAWNQWKKFYAPLEYFSILFN